MTTTKRSRPSGAPRRPSPRRSTKTPPRQPSSELVDVVNMVNQMFWADLRRSDQPIELTQWATMKRISRGPCTMSALARHKGVGLPTISKSIEMLARKGWIERWIDKTDRRQTLVRLTPAGRRMLDGLRSHLEDQLEQRMSVMPAAQREALAAHLREVRDLLLPGEEV